MAKQKRTPKNGSYFVALLVGCDQKFQNACKEFIASFGVYIKYTWPTGIGQVPIDKRSIPENLDVVIVLRDNKMSRHERDRFTHNVRQMNSWVLLAPGTHKGVVNELNMVGFSGGPLNLALIEGRALEVTAPVLPVDFLMEAHDLQDVPPNLPNTVQVESAPAVEGEDMPAKELAEKQQKLNETGAVIRQARQKMGYSAAEVSQMLKGVISGAAILHVENGKGAASAAMLEIFEHVYNLEPNSLPRLGDRDNHSLREKAAKLLGLKKPSKEVQTMQESIPAHGEPVPHPTLQPEVKVTKSEEITFHSLCMEGTLSEFLSKVAWLQGEFAKYGITRVELTTTRVVIEQQDAKSNPPSH